VLRMRNLKLQSLDAMSRRLWAVSLVVLLTACTSSTSPDAVGTTSAPRELTAAEPFPVTAFADISADPVPKERAEQFEAALAVMSERFNGLAMSATVLSPSGTWSGAVGRADDRRAAGIDDQFGIGSVTKSLQAAQVMQLVEAGRLRLDGPVDEHLPADLGFDANGATVGQLMGMRSGLPDYWPVVKVKASVDRERAWTTADVLAMVPAQREPAGTSHEYADTNYLLLQQVIEHVTGRTVVETMRDGGVLDIGGIERLVYQPDERPTAPMAMPGAMSRAAWKKGRGYLPSIASVTAYNQFASSSLSLAHWWQALCSGKLVSQDSLTTMATFVDGYGLGLTDVTAPYATSYGHPGSDVGFVAWAGCLPDSGSVVVVLSNTGLEDITMMQPLVLAAESDVDTTTAP
jgi:D-alanyl-D-alanine carboxypeptidase